MLSRTGNGPTISCIRLQKAQLRVKNAICRNKICSRLFKYQCVQMYMLTESLILCQISQIPFRHNQYRSDRLSQLNRIRQQQRNIEDGSVHTSAQFLNFFLKTVQMSTKGNHSNSYFIIFFSLLCYFQLLYYLCYA